ncbi:subunit of TIM23 translocase complex [Apiotrichum porosum]|uniref:Subunit of TIM23 translocase complex n=1 Tax=Apiotrichum porosum TaxID=105984 RepID=A0A427XMS6_9TREE|nr:subunit of TIM23 translocase complex [Apiotrichum porosum]RSH80054.1 subunit of TIM23 translocase complex [Apiotrichum porosum]
MPPPPQTTQGGSTFDKMKMGAIMGTGVGLTIGLIFGGVSILSRGPGPRGTIATLGQYMASSAATFGFFMSIGSVIRTDSRYALPPHLEAARRNLRVEIMDKRN